MKNIGVVGAGIMAAGMAQNFLKHGHEVFVWNRSSDRLESLIAAGAQVCGSPRAVAETADIVIECVADDEASRSVWLGDEGILAGASTDKVLVTSATLTLDWIDEIAGLCKEKDLKFLDIPLTGSRAGAEGGTLKLLVGGDAKTLDEIRSELAAISEKIYHFGPNGAGMRFKLVLNSLIAIHVNAAAQAMGLAEKSGLDLDTVHHALFDGGMGPASPTTNLAFTLRDQPDVMNWAIKWVEKDLRYVQAMAEHYGVDFDLLNDTQSDYLKAKESGYAERDMTAITELYRKDRHA